MAMAVDDVALVPDFVFFFCFRAPLAGSSAVVVVAAVVGMTVSVLEDGNDFVFFFCTRAPLSSVGTTVSVTAAAAATAVDANDFVFFFFCGAPSLAGLSAVVAATVVGTVVVMAVAAAAVDSKAVPLGFLFCCLAEARVGVAGSGVAFFFLGLLVAIVEHGGWRLIYGWRVMEGTWRPHVTCWLYL